ncbi:MAG: beta-1,6-N-acetylglucosaminyltransferase [Chitinophagaceae bacterium]
MEKAYIILAHKNIEQLNRLLQRLDDNASFFFIHIDKKLSVDEMPALSKIPDRIYMVKRINTHWAGLSLVRATLLGMKAIKATQREFHTITLLSGQDYPVKCNEDINTFFKNADRRIMMEYFKVPNFDKWSPRGGMYRLDKYYFGLKFHQRYIAKAMNFVVNIFPFLKRKQPGNLKPYGGSQWWTMNMDALNYILRYVKDNPSYLIFHKSTFAPDELFFQTILLNAKDETICNSIVNNNKRFIRWDGMSMSHPALLQKDDFRDLIASDDLFARKLDLSKHPEIFDLIDKNCLNKDGDSVRLLL